MWLETLARLDSVRAVYAGQSDGLGNIGINGCVNAFFVDCNHLREWIKQDIGSMQGVAASDVDRHFWKSAPLLACNAICNSHKHPKRKRGATAAGIRETTMGPTGARVTIEVNWASESATPVDALELAEDCVRSWREFFASVGIAEP